MQQRKIEEIEELLKPVKLGALPDRPLVSVLTANYNYAKYLPEALDSVLHQTYDQFEVIVCDDGSTDESCEILEGYVRRDPRIKLTRKANGGVASALNVAYGESKGEIVCLLDADDRFLPDKLKSVVEVFRSNPCSGFLGHRLFLIDADGNRHGSKPLFTRHPCGWYGPFSVMHGDFPPGISFGSGLCLRREISDLIFPLPVKFKSGADAIIMVLAPLMTPIVGIDAPLTDYRCHGRNVTNTADVTLESIERDLHVTKMLWEIRKEFLARIDPRLNELSLEFDQHLGTLVFTYMQVRLRSSGQQLRAYRNLVQARDFVRLHVLMRWFWRLSILLPRPVFRHALNETLRPGPVKQFIWRMKNGTNLARQSPAAAH